MNVSRKLGNSKASFKKYFYYSLIFHILIAILFLTQKKSILKSDLEKDRIDVLINGENSSLGSFTPETKQQKLARPKKILPQLKDLMSQNFNPAPASDRSRHAEDGSGSAKGLDLSEEIDLETEFKLTPFLRALWKQISDATEYPDDLARARVTGLISVHLIVDKTGVFTGNILRVEGDNRILSSYATAVTIYALRSPLPQKLHVDRDQMLIVARFSFKNFGPGENPPEQTVQIFKNALMINRYGYVDPKLNQELEKFFTNYFPPIIPVPGGFYIDLLRTYELIQNIGSEKIDPDQSRTNRIRKMKEQWEQTIKKSDQ